MPPESAGVWRKPEPPSDAGVWRRVEPVPTDLSLEEVQQLAQIALQNNDKATLQVASGMLEWHNSMLGQKITGGKG